jgi:hypothetical protein
MNTLSDKGRRMETAAVPAARAHALLTWRAWLIALSYVLVGIAALVPRIVALGTFINGDEANYWLHRSDVFLQAVRDGDYAQTVLTTHPGVTTMWLGAAGLVLKDALYDSGLVSDQSWSTILGLIRTPVVLAHVVCILVGYALLRKLVSAPAAALAALLWAVDPFVVGYSRLLHVDALLASFATLSLLAASLYWHHQLRPWALALSAVCAALAMLSKSPGVVLCPVVGAIALAAAWRDDPSPRRVVRAMLPFVVWCVLCGLTVVVVWPAMWSDPYTVYERLRSGVEAEALGEHQGGNFFLGRPDDNPGWLFYPASLALRLTPWTLAGLLLLPLGWWRLKRNTQHDLAGLTLFALLLTVGLSLFTKKLNRYLIPAFPALDIIAAVGLVGFADWLRAFDTRRRVAARGWGRMVGAAVLAAVVVLAPLNALRWHPYGLIAFNQALGGLDAAARTVALGSGEGLEQVAAWLNDQPDITGVTTITPLASSIQPYLREGADAIDVRAAPQLPANAGYVVVYINRAQKVPLDPPLDQFYGVVPPLHIVQLKGLPYAWIYHAPPAMATQRTVDFGDALRLHGLSMSAVERGQPLTVQLAWLKRAESASDYVLFAHLIGPDGQRVAQVDIPYPVSAWQPGRYERTEVPLALPADAPAGQYRLMIGLYDPATGQRLPLGSAAADPALNGPDALLLTEFDLR